MIERVRVFFLVAVVAGLTFVVSVLAIVFCVLGLRRLLYFRLLRLWGALSCRLSGFKVVVKNKVNGSVPQGVIIANHQSLLDIFILHGALPVDALWVAKQELFKIPFIGWAMRFGGYMSTSRRDEWSLQMRKVGEKLKREGLSLVLFPEGTRSTDGKLGRFTTGAVRFAKAFSLPVVPVAISSNVFRFMRPGGFPDLGKMRGSVVTVTFFDPLFLSSDVNPRELTEAVRASIVSSLASN